MKAIALIAVPPVSVRVSQMSLKDGWCQTIMTFSGRLAIQWQVSRCYFTGLTAVQFKKGVVERTYT